jgi:hypothetical protein
MNKNHHRRSPVIALWVFLLVVAFSCSDISRFDCLKPAGEQSMNHIRDDQPFHTISIRDDIHLVVHPGQQCKSMIYGPENLLDKIDVHLEDSVLHVRNRNTCNWVREFGQEFTFHLYTPEIRSIQFGGTGNLTFTDTLRQASFILEVWNGHGHLSPLVEADNATFKLHSGVAVLSPLGQAQYMDVYASGMGQFDGLGFHAQRVFAQHYGSNDAFIRAEELLQVRIISVGNIYHTGEAQTEVIERQGKGELIRLP